MRKNSNTPQKFWSRVDIKRPDECWLWTGPKTKIGYGLARLSEEKNRLTTAHRTAWKITYGAIEGKLEVAHKCANKLCVNPSHLYLSSRKENLREQAWRNSGYVYPASEKETEAISRALIDRAKWDIKHNEYQDEIMLAIYSVITSTQTIKIKNTDFIIMPCGHSSQYVSSSTEGTSFCVMCGFLEANGRIRNIEKALNVSGLYTTTRL